MGGRDPRARLAAAGASIVERVERVLPGWITGRVAYIADAWGRWDPETRVALDARARDAADAATERVTGALRELFSAEARDQRTTPLEIVRTSVREITEVLASAGVPPVERDAFEERAFPDDPYGVTPASLAELGDDDLGPLQLEWGLAKVRVLRADS